MYIENVTVHKVSQVNALYSTLFAIRELILTHYVAGWSRLVAYLLGSQEVVGSKPTPAPKKSLHYVAVINIIKHTK